MEFTIGFLYCRVLRNSRSLFAWYAMKCTLQCDSFVFPFQVNNVALVFASEDDTPATVLMLSMEECLPYYYEWQGRLERYKNDMNERGENGLYIYSGWYNILCSVFTVDLDLFRDLTDVTVPTISVVFCMKSFPRDFNFAVLPIHTVSIWPTTHYLYKLDSTIEDY